MKAPRISLVISAYNEEKYIAECLQSVINNSGGKFFEIIVVDNNSTDQTANIVRQFHQARLVLEPHQGVTRARQRGYIEAAGDIIAFIDADTRIPALWYDRVIQEFKNPELACLSGPYDYFDIPRWKRALVVLYWYILAMPVYFIFGYMAMAGNLVIRKEVLEKMSGFDTSIDFYGDDTDTARRASTFGIVKFSPSFIIQSSGRRLTHQGIFLTTFFYVTNFISQVVVHRSVTKTSKDFR